jgi:hypothetical protein
VKRWWVMRNRQLGHRPSNCRPLWQDPPGKWTRLPIIQLRYQPNTQIWMLYCGHSYEDLDLATLIREIDEDPTCIALGRPLPSRRTGKHFATTLRDLIC